jgi:hypothetical protein
LRVARRRWWWWLRLGWRRLRLVRDWSHNVFKRLRTIVTSLLAVTLTSCSAVICCAVTTGGSVDSLLAHLFAASSNHFCFSSTALRNLSISFGSKWAYFSSCTAVRKNFKQRVPCSYTSR